MEKYVSFLIILPTTYDSTADSQWFGWYYQFAPCPQSLSWELGGAATEIAWMGWWWDKNRGWSLWASPALHIVRDISWYCSTIGQGLVVSPILPYSYIIYWWLFPWKWTQSSREESETHQCFPFHLYLLPIPSTTSETKKAGLWCGQSILIIDLLCGHCSTFIHSKEILPVSFPREMSLASEKVYLERSTCSNYDLYII